jgi:diguanylate cyclase (GGDEF)-like protein/PAS domain S-box-containing protein
MTLQFLWTAVASLLVLVGYQQWRIFRNGRDTDKREELFQIVTENAADMIALVDMKGHRLYNSPAYKRILGYSAAELSETSSFEQIHPDDRFKILEAARETRETGIGKRVEYRIKHKNGNWRVLESIASAIRDENGQVAKLVIVNRDITDRRQAEEQLEHSSFHDPLTGLPNRRHFLDRLNQMFAPAGREVQRRYALLLLDVDHFKALNETLGASAGDKVIREVGRRLAATLRQDDSIARPDNQAISGRTVLSRLGGDEFTILLDGVSDPSDAMRVANRLQTAVAAPFTLELPDHDSQSREAQNGPREVRTSASVGIALSTAAHKKAEDLLQDADVAMHRAKAMGGSRCEVFDQAMHTSAVSRLRLEADLRTAIAQRQFRVYYQPVVQLDNKRTVGFEALVRWNHPEHGLISPYRFIEAAEDTGLLVTIGHWLMVEVCGQLSEWQAGLSGAPLQVTVNISARQLADARLVSDVQSALGQAGVEPSRLQLEITEMVAATDTKLTLSVFSQLKHLGIGMILDDFGSGRSSLSGLWRYPIDGLKIDRALIAEMLADRGAADIVEVIILLAHKMKLKAIAGGIESPRHLERLREMGCEYGQGYHFAQPMEAKAALQYMRRQETLSRGTG